MNQLNASLQHSIVALASGGMSRRQIARQLNLDRETVARYLRLAEDDSKPAIVPTGAEGLPPSPPACAPGESARSQPGRRAQCAPWAAAIEQRVLSGPSAQRIYQDLVATHRFAGGYWRAHIATHLYINSEGECWVVFMLFAMGVPVANTTPPPPLAEMFTMQRYLQPEDLEKHNLHHFESWAATFGEPVTSMELSPDGAGYRLNTRFVRFINVPELMQMFRQSSDVKLDGD